MLQRAASNAYSWWWASHVRTKQSKWLEHNLQDMEDKVQHVVKLIEEDGDSFARRAEMYYKKRPELLNFVEESYRAYRALAERYDHISTELQNANNTIANLCPDQIALMEEDDEYSPKIPRKFPQVPVANSASVPKVPKASIRDWKGLITASKHKGKAKKETKRNNAKKEVTKSGLNKTEAFEEIDQLQKDILALQTVKEFVKSSYESGLSKYWGIENQISEIQERIFSLEDEFGTGKVIEDDEARRLMAETAIKSCKETLDHLQEKQEKYNQEATEEHKKIGVARQKLKSIKREFLHDQADEEVESAKAEESQFSNGEPDHVMKERQETKVIQEKVKEHFEVGPLASLTVSELAEKIDELVNKVISLETSLSSQTVLIGRLRTEADDLHAQIRTLEDHAQIRTLEEDKTTVADDAKNLSCRLKNVEEKLHDIQDLDWNVERQNNTLQTHFDEARSRLEHLAEKLNSVKSDEELEDTSSFTDEGRNNEVVKNVEEQEKLTHANGKEEGNTAGREDVVRDEKEHDSGVASIDNQGDDIKPAEKLNGVISHEEPENSSSFTDEERNNEVVKNVEEQEKLTHVNGKEEGNTPGREDMVRDEKEHDSGVASIDNQGEDIKPVEKKKVIFQDPISKDLIAEQKPKSSGDDDLLKKDSSQAETDIEDEHEWQQMLLNGLEDKEKILLSEYTKILRNYKEVKKKLSDMEKKEKDQEFDVALQISDLKSAIAKRDEEIKQLRQRLNLDEDSNTKEAHQASSDDHTAKSEHTVTHLIKKADEEIKLKFVHQPHVMSQVEEQLRMDIDAILEENLEFWLKFSTSYHQIQKFKTTIHDLQNDISKIKEKKKQEGSNSGDTKSDARPLYKHLKEIEAELKVWLEQGVSIKDELERRFSSLCNIQEKITAALKAGVEEEEIIFSSYQAAKFQGEILNMKQENNKVSEELQAGVDHVTSLQEDIDKSLKNLDVEFGLNEDQPQLRHSGSRARVPLRSFIFGTKVKKQKYSIFSCVHPNRKYQVLRSGMRF